MKYQIRSWHGFHKGIWAELNKIATWYPENNGWVYEGDLNHFEENFSYNFCVLRLESGNLIGVTQHNSFGMR